MGEMKFMQRAIELSQLAIDKNLGGPFGCVIVREGKIVGEGHNQVTTSNDPTAHAEVMAIRDACRQLNTYQLEGCDLYTTCEPCPMCLGAIYWSRVDRIFYANNRADAAAIGFDDALIYEEFGLDLENRKIPIKNLGREEALKIFEAWQAKEDKRLY